MSRAAIFLDKDGTLVHDVPYNVDPSRVRLMSGAGEALAMLRQAGYALVVVSNQPGVAEGRYDATALEAVRQCLDQLLEPHEVSLDGFFCCPHAVDASPPCGCRKPAPGLLLQAAERLNLDLRASWMLGDILNDVEAGRRAGCRTALVHCGNEDQWQITPWRVPDVIVPNLLAAARFVLGRARAEMRRTGSR